jgi:hypothetical protein
MARIVFLENRERVNVLAKSNSWDGAYLLQHCRAKMGLPYVTQHVDEAFLGSMRGVTSIQATTKLLKDRFDFP